MTHVFAGPDGPMGTDERRCVEPHTESIAVVYHEHYTTTPGGSFLCNQCGERFLDTDAGSA